MNLNKKIIIPQTDHNRNELSLLVARKNNKKIFVSRELKWAFIDSLSWLDAIFYADLVPAEAEQRVKEIIEKIKLGAAPVRWTLGPVSRPLGLGELLLKHGFARHETRAAMAVEINKKGYVPVPGLEIEVVKNKEVMGLWNAVISEGLFKRPMKPAIFANVLNEKNVRFYLGRYNGIPAATTMSFLSSGVAGLYCVATLPEFRGRGIGRALTENALLEAKAAGYSTAVLQASQMGEKVYKKIGFEEVCKFEIFDYKLQQALSCGQKLKEQ